MELVTDISYNVFEIFGTINDSLPNSKLLEVSVRQSQVTLIFDDEVIPLSDLRENKWIDGSGESYLATTEEGPVIVVPFNVEELKTQFSNPFKLLYDLILLISDEICKCPALEIVFSNQYLKCYLDKPGLRVEDLKKYENIFKLEGTLELHSQRPYLLFINSELSESDFIDN